MKKTAFLRRWRSRVRLCGYVPSLVVFPPFLLTSRWSEPSQILNTLNTFIRTLNGETTDIDSTSGNFSLGSSVQAAVRLRR